MNASRTGIPMRLEAALRSTQVKITTASGTGQSSFQYKDSRNILFNFDDNRGKMGNCWHAATIETSDLNGIVTIRDLVDYLESRS